MDGNTADCNECGSKRLRKVTRVDRDGFVEVRCLDCGHYQVEMADDVLPLGPEAP